MDRLSPLDAAFLLAEDEDRNTSMAIASVAVLAGEPPGRDEFAEFVRGRLPAIPRWRQRVRTSTLDLGWPVWVDVPQVDLDFHIRLTALPAPGDDAALCALTGRIMSQRMDREHPLWEMWVVDGLAGERWALVTKVHHCMADGIAGTQLYDVMCNGGPEKQSTRHHADWFRFPLDQAKIAVDLLRRPDRAMSALQGLASYGASLLPTPPTSLIGHVGRQRRYGLARASLSEVKDVSRAFRVTVNDVVLAVVSGAYRRLLLARGDRPTAGSVRTFVPVSVRGQNSHDVDNQISAMLAMLPVDVEDPAERLRVVHDRLSGLKTGKQALAGAAVLSLARQEIYAPVAWAIRLAAHLPHRSITTVTTNVPGPRKPFTLLGREILEIFPYVPIGVLLRTGIAGLKAAAERIDPTTRVRHLVVIRSCVRR
jgi:diacylglycerol O-acyltransferase